MKRDTVARERADTREANKGTKAADEQTDRERSIQTDRERDRSTGITRRSATSPIFGSSYGQIAGPHLLMRRIADDMDRLFENFGLGRSGFGLSPFADSELGADFSRTGTALQQARWSPQVETFRRGDKLIVRADLPGLSKDDVSVEVDDGLLAISGERRAESEEERDNFYRSERTYGQFYRAIPLPEGISDDQIDASFNDGVLEVALPVPKEPEHKSKRIEIR